MSKTFPTFGPHGMPSPAQPVTRDEPKPVAIITGAGRGIGRATAVELSRRGYELALVARTESQLQETAKLCRTETLVLPFDVRDADGVLATVNQAMKRFGRIDALVNNAGLAPLGPFEETTSQNYTDVLSTNLGATIHFSREVYKKMISVWPGERGPRGGVIVNVSSYAARDPFPGFALYAAAKAGINGFTQALAKEGEPKGVRVHCVAPAGVETEMLRKIATTEQVPAETTLSPEAVASVIANCVTGELSATSGETIYLHR